MFVSLVQFHGMLSPLKLAYLQHAALIYPILQTALFNNHVCQSTSQIYQC